MIIAPTPPAIMDMLIINTALRIHQSSNQYRILFFFQARDQIVLAHAFSKKTQQLKEKDIELAERRMEDWIRRLTTGGVT